MSRLIKLLKQYGTNYSTANGQLYMYVYEGMASEKINITRWSIKHLMRILS